MSLIEVKSVYKTYTQGGRARDVLQDVSVSIKRGEFVSIVGASGSGKSTLMHILGLLDEPTRGEYVLEGQHFHHLTPDELSSIRNHKIGFIFQFFYLLPRLNAIENVMLPLLYQDVPAEEARGRALEWLQRLGLGDVAENRPLQLSGGQQQRVAIARALVTNPILILADEPTGSLDTASSEEVMRILKDLHAKTDLTIIIITHNPSLAEECQRMIELRDGKIIQDRSHD